jgi:hypothetical protein
MYKLCAKNIIKYYKVYYLKVNFLYSYIFALYIHFLLIFPENAIYITPASRIF